MLADALVAADVLVATGVLVTGVLAVTAGVPSGSNGSGTSPGVSLMVPEGSGGISIEGVSDGTVTAGESMSLVDTMGVLIMGDGEALFRSTSVVPPHPASRSALRATETRGRFVMSPPKHIA